MLESRERFEHALRESREHFDTMMRQSDERFQQAMREFREESAQRAAETQRVFKEVRTDVRTVGLSIVKTLNRHTRLLERIDRKLGVRGNGRPGNGRAG